MAKKRVANRAADRTIENSPVFKRKIDMAFDEYLTYGGISADALIRKLLRRAKSEGIEALSIKISIKAAS